MQNSNGNTFYSMKVQKVDLDIDASPFPYVKKYYIHLRSDTVDTNFGKFGPYDIALLYDNGELIERTDMRRDKSDYFEEYENTTT